MPHPGGRVLLAQVDEPLRRLREAHRDQHPLEHEVRPQLHHVAVLDRPGLALVRVHDHVARRRLPRDRLPLHPGREARAAVADEARRLQLGDDPVVRRECGEQLHPAARLVVRQRRIRRGEIQGGAVVRAVHDGRLDRVAAGQHGCEIAVPQALDAEHGDAARLLLLAREQVRGAQAVAHGADADADSIHRDAEERVEGGDLGNLAAPDVHVVGERVRELRRDRPDLAADAAEVVEQPRALDRQLCEQRGVGEDVDAAILVAARTARFPGQ